MEIAPASNTFKEESKSEEGESSLKVSTRLASVRGPAWRQSPGGMLCWMDKSLPIRCQAAETAKNLKLEPEAVFRGQKVSFETEPYGQRERSLLGEKRNSIDHFPVCKCREDEEGLREGLKRLTVLKRKEWPSMGKAGFCLETENLLDAAEMILKACLLRKESRVLTSFSDVSKPPSPSLSRSEEGDISLSRTDRERWFGKKSACEIKIPPDEVNPIRNSNPATAGLETERAS